MAGAIDAPGLRTPLLPNIWEPIPRFVSIGMLRNPITICSWSDKPEGDTETVLERYAVARTQAFIDPLGPIAFENTTVANNWDLIPTHAIIFRVPSDIFVDKNYWIYRRTKFADQWFRVLRLEDIGERQRMTWALVGLVKNFDTRLDPFVQKIDVEPTRPIDVSEHF